MSRLRTEWSVRTHEPDLGNANVGIYLSAAHIWMRGWCMISNGYVFTGISAFYHKGGRKCLESTSQM